MSPRQLKVVQFRPFKCIIIQTISNNSKTLVMVTVLQMLNYI